MPADEDHAHAEQDKLHQGDSSPHDLVNSEKDLGHWDVELVAGHPCDVFTPERSNPHGYVLLYLHGVHQNKLNHQAEFVQEFERHRLPVISPRTKRSWWSNRICAEFDPELTAEQHILRNILPYIQRRWHAAPPQIGLFGTSMGGQGALRFAYKFPDTFPVVAGISPAIDYQIRIQHPEEDEPLFDMYEDAEECRQDTALLHIHPLNWPRHQFFCCDPTDYPWADSADRLRMKLSSLGVPFEADLETQGGGHGFGYYNIMARKSIDFVVNALDRERLRVV